jgi:hypothetical protein
MPTHSSARSRRLAWAAVPFLAAASFAAVAIPVWIVRPFALQTPRSLAVSYALRAATPAASVLAALAVAALGVWLWRGARWWSRIALVLVCAGVAFVAWFAQQNHFEWMFRPVASAGFVAPAEASFVDPAEMVLAVAENDEAAAYPVRQVAYHHVVNDTVGGVPLVVTY